MLIIGLTGGIGSGKTTASNLFSDLGIPVIDTDLISRKLVRDDTSVLHKIIESFDDSILLDDGTLDRKQLSKIVFNDNTEKQKLENILHPKIRTEVTSLLQDYVSTKTPPQYVIIVIPLLFETDFRNLVDKILVITSREDLRIKRITQRDDRNMDEIRSILDSQVTDEIRISGADDVIENNGDLKKLESRIQYLHNKYSNPSR